MTPSATATNSLAIPSFDRSWRNPEDSALLDKGVGSGPSFKVFIPSDPLPSATNPPQELEVTKAPENQRHEVIRRKRMSPRSKDSYLQSWEGTVLAVHDDHLVARLFDKSNEPGEEIAEIDIEEISLEDHSLIREGAMFYWSIGYRDRLEGRERYSTIRFRRLPAWTSSQLEEAELKATEIRESLGWH